MQEDHLRGYELYGKGPAVNVAKALSNLASINEPYESRQYIEQQYRLREVLEDDVSHQKTRELKKKLNPLSNRCTGGSELDHLQHVSGARGI